MKLLFLVLLTFLVSQVRAESITIGCAVMTYDCYPMPDNTQKCNWGTDLGSISSVRLKKTGTGPSYDIWQGKLNGTARGNEYQLAIYQRREAEQTFNFLTIDLAINGIKISSKGQNIVETRYLSETEKTGVGVHCTSDIQPAP